MDSKSRCKRFGKHATALAAIASALLAAAPGVSHAVGFGNRQWTTIGSAGVDLRERTIDAGTAAVLDTGFNSTTLRYNVVAVDGLFATNPNAPALPTSTSMAAGFLDAGNNSQVVIRLRRTALQAPWTTTTLLTIDSNTFAASNLYQTQTRGCGPAFDFSQYAYFVEVTLSRNAGSPSPGIASIQIGTAAQCIGIAPN